MKMIIMAMVMGLGVLRAGRAAAASAAWEPLTEGLTETAMTTLAVAPQDARLLYAASAHGIHVSRDGGRTWRACFRLPFSAAVTSLAIDPFDDEHVFLATSGGLYGTFDAGRRWQRLFRGAGTGESDCRAVAFHPLRRHEAFLGTAGGLLVSVDGGRQWREAPADLPAGAIRFLTVDPTPPERLYVVADRGLFAGSGGLSGWERLFETSPPETSDAAEEAPEEPEQDVEDASHLSALAIDPQDPRTLYLAGSEGLLVSQDRGATWQRLPTAGLGATSIRHVALHDHSPTVVYAATPHGIARYQT